MFQIAGSSPATDTICLEQAKLDVSMKVCKKQLCGI